MASGLGLAFTLLILEDKAGIVAKLGSVSQATRGYLFRAADVEDLPVAPWLLRPGLDRLRFWGSGLQVEKSTGELQQGCAMSLPLHASVCAFSFSCQATYAGRL